MRARLFRSFLFFELFLASVMTSALSMGSGASNPTASPSTHLLPIRPLPDKLLIGYATSCNEGVVKAVQDGVNVVVWSFMEIEKNSGVKWNSLDVDCIRSTIHRLDKQGFDDVVHLVSFGGWNGPHLDPGLSAIEWFNIWKRAAGDVFHGIDWDLEGHDDLDSPTNTFSVECLEKLGCISRLAKEAGYIIGMAPPQSYLNPSNPEFSRSVTLREEHRTWHDEFQYFGANVYAYLLAKYSDYIDFVSVQFYESYSLAAMKTYGPEKIKASEYLESYTTHLSEKDFAFSVNFGRDETIGLSNQIVHLPQTKLVFGFANGWALNTGDKALFVDPREIEKAYSLLSSRGLEPRGFMFWVIGEEGTNDIFFASTLGKILFRRHGSRADSQEL